MELTPAQNFIMAMHYLDMAMKDYKSDISSVKWAYENLNWSRNDVVRIMWDDALDFWSNY